MEKWTEPIWQVWKLFDTLEQNLSENAKSVRDFLTLHVMEKWTEPIWQVWKLFDTLFKNAKSVRDFLTLHVMEKWTEPIWQVWKLFDTFLILHVMENGLNQFDVTFRMK